MKGIGCLRAEVAEGFFVEMDSYAIALPMLCGMTSLSIVRYDVGVTRWGLFLMRGAQPIFRVCRVLVMSMPMLDRTSRTLSYVQMMTYQIESSTEAARKPYVVSGGP